MKTAVLFLFIAAPNGYRSAFTYSEIMNRKNQLEAVYAGGFLFRPRHQFSQTNQTGA